MIASVLATIVLGGFGAAAYFGYKIVHTVCHIPEAYAAWDTGTLLVEYMDLHDRRWPSSWDDLLSVMNNPINPPMFRGARAGDTNYALSLRKRVAIDWHFNPRQCNESLPVTRPDGTKFPVVWSGAEPNKMVRAYLTDTNTARSH